MKTQSIKTQLVSEICNIKFLASQDNIDKLQKLFMSEGVLFEIYGVYTSYCSSNNTLLYCEFEHSYSYIQVIVQRFENQLEMEELNKYTNNIKFLAPPSKREIGD